MKTNTTTLPPKPRDVKPSHCPASILICTSCLQTSDECYCEERFFVEMNPSLIWGDTWDRFMFAARRLEVTVEEVELISAHFWNTPMGINVAVRR